MVKCIKQGLIFTQELPSRKEKYLCNSIGFHLGSPIRIFSIEVLAICNFFHIGKFKFSLYLSIYICVKKTKKKHRIYISAKEQFGVCYQRNFHCFLKNCFFCIVCKKLYSIKTASCIIIWRQIPSKY